MKIGDRCFVRGHIDEIRKDTVIVRNDGGYFGTILSEVTGELPSAQPEIVRCKDCKHWRDSDGVYRRGTDAESKCPLNTKEVYAGTFYCGYAERRTDE